MDLELFKKFKSYLVSVFGFIKNKPLLVDSLGLCGVSLEGDASVTRFVLGSNISLLNIKFSFKFKCYEFGLK